MEGEASSAAAAASLAADRNWRARLRVFVESSRFQGFITTLILFNAAVLGLETSADMRERFGDLMTHVNNVVLAVFVVEILLKLVACGWSFFRSGWNIFDSVIVGVALVPASGPLSILRALRILRVLRLLSTVRRLRMLVDSLLHALPGIGWSAALLMMMFYIFGVMGTELFGAAFPEWFGTLGRTMFSLFQIMTLESWSMGIARPVMEVYPYAWLFFVPYILISSFIVLNLFIAIIVSATQSVHEKEWRAEQAEADERADREREEILGLLREIRGELGRGREEE